MGREEYDRRLRAAAGDSWTAERLQALAARDVEALDQRLQTLAEQELGSQLRDGEDWRDLFSRLQQDHAGTPEATLELYRQEVERARAFVAESGLADLPSEGVEVLEIRNPIFQRYFALAMYLDGQLAVTLRPADGEGGEGSNEHLLDHCRVCVPPLAVHEVYPGHHLAYSRAGELLEGPERLAANRRNVVYHEGWALYAEQLMLDHGYYEGEPARALGAWRLLYLRALRAWIDPALHAGTLSDEEAEALYRERARLSPASARSEIDRHAKDPVLKASYYLGLMQILELRQQVVEQLGEQVGEQVDVPDLRRFHRQFLGRPAPIPQVARERFGLELGESTTPIWAPTVQAEGTMVEKPSRK